MSDYKSNVFTAIDSLLPPAVRPKRSLDFGAGDGWYWDRFEQSGRLGSISGVDVQHRTEPIRVPEMYDGERLPYGDRAFDLAYAIDVLHHCPDPVVSLAEMARCTNEWLVIKDHRQRNAVEFAMLSVLDEVGNRKFGIPSRYRYQRDWQWLEVIDSLGFELIALEWPVDCNRGVIGRLTKQLNFVGVWRRR